MSIQAKISPSLYIDIENPIPIKKKQLTKAEKLYKHVEIHHAPYIKFPGRFGSKKFDCGSIKYVYSCDCIKTTKIIRKSCNNINCPNCYITANRRHGKEITRRLIKILRQQIRQKKIKPHFNHITFGPKNAPFMTYDEFLKWKGSIMRKVKKCDASGVLFFHAYRKKKKLILCLGKLHQKGKKSKK